MQDMLRTKPSQVTSPGPICTRSVNKVLTGYGKNVPPASASGHAPKDAKHAVEDIKPARLPRRYPFGEQGAGRPWKEQ